ncbi:putative calmodulin-binding protein [Dioscorea alata]|uniref:Calmodulin-binding protein n=1 Tax=Dioscorea alata TaxID=55571 RepID=A0ACB7WKM9_DIOAL|nr:putative calmodulin-binding protein [Dioscorea alata]
MFQEAKALLGRLEYQRGNIEAALRVFEGIDLQAALQCLQPTLSKKTHSRRRRSHTESIHSISHSSVTLVLEVQYLKSLSLQKLGKANECDDVLDAVEKIFQNGIPDTPVDTKLRETVNKVVEILLEHWKQTGKYQEVLATYRRAFLGPWNLECDFQARIQKRFALFLLFTNILEEVILLLMILMRKSLVDKSQWDPSVMELLTFALSIGGQTSMLGQKTSALSLLRKSLSKQENTDDILALLLASKICSEDQSLAYEGIEYARRALANAQVSEKHLKSAGINFLGICLGKQAKVLNEAISIERHNLDLLFDLGIQYAKNGNLISALRCSKQFIDATSGSMLKGWRLRVLADVILDAALDKTAKLEQGPLLRLKAKLKVARSLPMDAVETYRLLFALIQAQKNLSHWRDIEICLEKVSMGVLLWRTGSKSLSAARAFLSDALRLERTNRLAWYYLGMVYKDEGRLFDATDCFQAASMLEESDPIESFSSISRASHDICFLNFWK